MQRNSKLVITIILVAAVLVGGLVLVLGANDNSTGSKSSSSTSKGNQKVDDTTIDQLISSGKSQKCTFTYKTSNKSDTSNTGTVYVSKGSMRGDFLVYESTQDSKNESHIIIDKQYQYIWQDDTSDGVKYSLASLEAAQKASNSNNIPASQQGEIVDQKQPYDFNCESWSPDQAMFKAPSNVKFSDLSAQLQQAQNTQTQGCAGIADASSRAICEQATQGQ